MGLKEQFEQADCDLRTWQEWLPRVAGLFSQNDEIEKLSPRRLEKKEEQVAGNLAKAANS
jgi:hypothetical protein